MLKVTIKSIELENFKGLYSAKIDFDEKKNEHNGKENFSSIFEHCSFCTAFCNR